MTAVDKNARISNQSLRHVLVVGGEIGEWDSLDGAAWNERAQRVADVASRAGVRWVTLVPYGPSAQSITAAIDRQLLFTGTADVIVDPHGDGRKRFAAAMESMPAGDPVNEASVAAVLYEPADSEPDLVIVFGPDTQLPPSLVWELAYAELVFTDATWVDLDADVLEVAFADFAARRRRFGGLDD